MSNSNQYIIFLNNNLSNDSVATGFDIIFPASADMSGDTGWFIHVKSWTFLRISGSPIGIKTSWMIRPSISREKIDPIFPNRMKIYGNRNTILFSDITDN